MSEAHPLDSKHRLEALSDGIYAIALTLLVLELKIPALPHSTTESQLAEALLAVGPKALTWVLSFWIIGLFWLGQLRLLRLAKSLNTGLTFIELVHLSLITLFPFTTALLGEFLSHTVAAALYAGHLVLIAVVSWWRIAYFVTHSELHGPDVSPMVVTALRRRGLLLTGCAFATFGLAFVFPPWNTLAMLPTLLIFRPPRPGMSA
jgi:uncharacterized membrane protein